MAWQEEEYNAGMQVSVAAAVMHNQMHGRCVVQAMRVGRPPQAMQSLQQCAMAVTNNNMEQVAAQQLCAAAPGADTAACRTMHPDGAPQ